MVFELQMYGNRQWANNYDIYEGRFELFDADDRVVFDSGILALPAPERDIVVPVPNVGDVVRLLFTPTDDQGSLVGIGSVL